jgi:hypothetical protein
VELAELWIVVLRVFRLLEFVVLVHVKLVKLRLASEQDADGPGDRRLLRCERWVKQEVELGAAGRLAVLTSPLAVIEARRNLEVKRPDAVS